MSVPAFIDVSEEDQVRASRRHSCPSAECSGRALSESVGLGQLVTKPEGLLGPLVLQHMET